MEDTAETEGEEQEGTGERSLLRYFIALYNSASQMGPLYRTLLIGLFFTLVCVWGSYFAFMTYEKHNQEIVTLVDELENQKRVIVGLQRDLGEAAVKKGSVAVSVESDQKKLDSQVSVLKKHGLTGFSQQEIHTSSGTNLRNLQPTFYFVSFMLAIRLTILYPCRRQATKSYA